MDAQHNSVIQPWTASVVPIQMAMEFQTLTDYGMYPKERMHSGMMLRKRQTVMVMDTAIMRVETTLTHVRLNSVIRGKTVRSVVQTPTKMVGQISKIHTRTT